MQAIPGVISGGINLMDGLVSYWDLDETSGTRYDSHGSNDMTDINTVRYTASGKQGNATEFLYGDSDHLYQASPTGIDATSLTWAFWFKQRNLDATTNTQLAAGLVTGPAYSHYAYVFKSNHATNPSKLALRLFGTSVSAAYTSAAVVDTTVWNFCVMRWDADANEAKFWHYEDDGSLAATETVDITGHGGIKDVDTLYFGNILTGGGNNADGWMDCVGFWNRALSEDEITWLYNNGSGRQYSDL
jgi:hypothetical protein